MEATIDPTIIKSFSDVLPSGGVAKLEAALRKLRELDSQSNNAVNPDSLGAFLNEFATCVADLFATTSVAVWFRSEFDEQLLQRKVAIGWENLLLDAEAEESHMRLLQFAIEQPSAIACKPFSAPSATAASKVKESKEKQSQNDFTVSNPTDSYLLLAPIQFEQTRVAVLELALGPKPLRKPHQQLMASYLDWLNWLSDILQSGLRRFFERAGSPLWIAHSLLQQTSNDVEAIQQQIRDHIERSLQQLAGQNFGSLEANQSIAKQIHTLLDSKGLRVRCSECGAPAILRCQKAGNSKTGAFMFDHYLEAGRTFHGGQTTLPQLFVVDKPPRRQSKQ